MCCAQKKEFIGSPFYNKIDICLEKTGNKDLDSIFKKIDDPLEKTEETRQQIATSFKHMIITCGTCVLQKPDIEQCLRAYIIKLVSLLVSSSKTEDLDPNLLMSNFMSFSSKSPFISLNEEKIAEFKQVFGVNASEGILKDIKDSIINFLTDLVKLKEVYESYYVEVGELKDEISEFVEILRLNYAKYGLSTTWDYMQIGKRNLLKIFDMRHLLNIFTNISIQIAEAVEVFSAILTDKSKYKVYVDLAKDVAKKNITDMKDIVWETTNESKLAKLSDWKNNFVYTEIDELDMK